MPHIDHSTLYKLPEREAARATSDRRRATDRVSEPQDSTGFLLLFVQGEVYLTFIKIRSE